LKSFIVYRQEFDCKADYLSDGWLPIELVFPAGGLPCQMSINIG